MPKYLTTENIRNLQTHLINLNHYQFSSADMANIETVDKFKEYFGWYSVGQHVSITRPNYGRFIGDYKFFEWFPFIIWGVQDSVLYLTASTWRSASEELGVEIGGGTGTSKLQSVSIAKTEWVKSYVASQKATATEIQSIFN